MREIGNRVTGKLVRRFKSYSLRQTKIIRTFLMGSYYFLLSITLEWQLNGNNLK
jgi:hypothetical protein